MRNLIKKYLSESKINRDKIFDFSLALSILYLLVITALIILSLIKGNALVIQPDYAFFLILVILVITKGNKKGFIRDFAPFFVLLFAYDAMRGYADNFGFAVNYKIPINIDLFLGFGQLPTMILQNFFVNFAFLDQFEFLVVILYSIHFATPIFFGFIIWLENREQYLKYLIILLLVAYSALITFWLFPVAPPWMAANEGLINVKPLFNEIAQNHNLIWLIGVYALVNANPVASFPSLHFAFPFLGLVFSVVHKKKISTIFFLIYTILISITIVYLAEHYVADLIAGAIYVLIMTVIAEYIFADKRINKYFFDKH